MLPNNLKIATAALFLLPKPAVTEEMGLQQQFLAVTMALGLPGENVTGGRLLQVLLKKRNDP